MDGVLVLDTENYGVAGNKIKGDKLAKGTAVGSAARKKLGDISNLPRQSQDAKPQSISINTKDYINRLHQENMALVKLLAERNKIIELSAAELQKLRTNFQKVQQQNLQLAQTNSQMLAELNSGKDKLKALQHELGCKNGLLKAIKLKSKSKANKMRCQSHGNEVGTIKQDRVGESSQEDDGWNKLYNTKKIRKSTIKSLESGTVNPVQARENIDKERPCSRRQSAEYKSGEEQAEVVCGLSNALGSDTFKSVQVKKMADKKRRQSARLKSQEQVEDLHDNVLHEGLSETRNDDPEKLADKKRLFPRRQSSRLKAQLVVEEPVDAPDSVHDAGVHERGPTTSISPLKNESVTPNNCTRFEAQSSRSSLRPKRQAVGKVLSYKEIPINVKMRRVE